MMKLSELQQICKNLAKLTPEDAEVEFRIDDAVLTLEAAQIDGRAEVDMTRGNLKACPLWENKIVMYFVEPGVTGGSG
jgi:hypothetical protein